MATFVVESEEQAWALLSQAISGELDFADAPQVDFKGWPDLKIHLPSTPIESSISPTMMAAFIELQKSINRSYLLVSSNSADLRALTTAEREQLEIRVKVDKGSSDYLAPLAKAVERIGIEAIGKMDPSAIIITVVSVALIVGGVTAFRAWLANKVEQRKAELAEKQQDTMLEMHTAALTAGTENMRILAQALAHQPLLEDIEAVTEPARTQVIKSLGEEGGGSVQGVELDARTAQEIGAQKRQQSENVRMAGNFRVVKVDTSVPDGFRVTLADHGEEITASMQDALISEEHKAAIQKAEWAKKPVYVELTARKLRNRYVDAIVLNARDAAPVVETKET